MDNPSPFEDYRYEDNPYAAPATDAFTYEGFLPTRLTLAQVLFAFHGRVPRRIYWGGTIGVLFGFYAIVFFFSLIFAENELAMGIIFIMLYIVFLWSTLAIQVKRWHDRNKPGWMVLINLIPLIGPIWTFIECGCGRGTVGPNRYGGDPT